MKKHTIWFITSTIYISPMKITRIWILCTENSKSLVTTNLKYFRQPGNILLSDIRNNLFPVLNRFGTYTCTGWNFQSNKMRL